MSIKDILRILRPLRRRMHLNNGILCVFICLAAAGTITAVIAYVSLWIPVPNLIRTILFVYLGFAAAGLVISAFLSPGVNRLIRTADLLGLKERVVTAWQLQEDSSPVARLQRQDTFSAVSKTDFKNLYPVRIPIKLVIAFSAAVILTSVSFAIPAFARDVARQIENLEDTVKEQVKKIEEVKEELEYSDLEQEELEKLQEEIDRLKEELQNVRTEEDVLKALTRSENELKKLDPQQQLQQLGEAMKTNSMMAELGDALKNENMEDIKQALESLMQKLEKQELLPEELAEMLKEAAEQVDNNEASNELKNIAEQLAFGSTGSMSNAMGNLENMISGVMQSNGSQSMAQASGQLSQALEQAKYAVSQLNSSLAAASGSGEPREASASSSGHQSNESQSTQGSGQQGSGSEQGGTQSGSGAGQTQGGGGGAGEGSTNEDAGISEGNSSGQSRAPGEREEDVFEQLYDPNRLGGESNTTTVNGQKQDSGQSVYSQVDNLPVQKGVVLPYREVLANYKDEAVSYMENAEIPPAMKEIVREYFESLE